jgi:hypothetical protein
VDINSNGSERIHGKEKINSIYFKRLKDFAGSLLDQTAQATNITLTHYGNGFYDIANILKTDYANDQKFSSYLSNSGPNSVFVIQTDSQHCRTGTLVGWDGIEKDCQ